MSQSPYQSQPQQRAPSAAEPRPNSARSTPPPPPVRAPTYAHPLLRSYPFPSPAAAAALLPRAFPAHLLPLRSLNPDSTTNASLSRGSGGTAAAAASRRLEQFPCSRSLAAAASPWLLVGGLGAALNSSFLLASGVTHVILVGPALRPAFAGTVVRMRAHTDTGASGGVAETARHADRRRKSRSKSQIQSKKDQSESKSAVTLDYDYGDSKSKSNSTANTDADSGSGSGSGSDDVYDYDSDSDIDDDDNEDNADPLSPKSTRPSRRSRRYLRAVTQGVLTTRREPTLRALARARPSHAAAASQSAQSGGASATGNTAAEGERGWEIKYLWLDQVTNDSAHGRLYENSRISTSSVGSINSGSLSVNDTQPANSASTACDSSSSSSTSSSSAGARASSRHDVPLPHSSVSTVAQSTTAASAAHGHAHGHNGSAVSGRWLAPPAHGLTRSLLT